LGFPSYVEIVILLHVTNVDYRMLKELKKYIYWKWDANANMLKSFKKTFIYLTIIIKKKSFLILCILASQEGILDQLWKGHIPTILY